MATTAGSLSAVSISSNSAVLSSAVATGGTAPYTYQWYQSTTTGFSVGPTNIITGATSLTFNPVNLVPATQYYFKVVATDSSSPTVAGTSSQLAVLTLPVVLAQNSFAQAPVVGQIDQRFDYDTFPVQVDASASTALLYQGQAVKLVANTTGGIPRVIAVSSKSDNVFGFVNFDIKSRSFGVGNIMEVSQGGNVIWLYATGAITQGAQVCVDPTVTGGVQATGNSATYVGYALDGAAAVGALIRVKLACPTFTTA